MSDEEWRPVVGWEGLYEVSAQGRVRSLRRGLILKPDDSGPYLRVTLNNQGLRRRFTVHRLMAIAWFGDRKGLIVRHKNDDPVDNRIENLEWGTHADNTRDAVRNGGHRNVKKTHCPQGHEYTPENTQLFRGYQRRCKICSKKWAREKDRKARERGLPDPEDTRHGTLTGYTYYGCKCEQCRQAMREYELKRREKV